MAGPSNIPALEYWLDVEIKQTSPQVCAICDNGGDLILCNGVCRRQFHFVHTKYTPRSKEECQPVFVDRLKHEKCESWLCEDCLDGKAQCFMCGHHNLLAKVKKCKMAYCSRFYCKECVHKDDPQCPIHKCMKCRKSSRDPNCLSDMVQCLRCPKAWHLGCLEKDFVMWARNAKYWIQESHEEHQYLCYCEDHKHITHSHISWLKGM
jgi:hypothetical protein